MTDTPSSSRPLAVPGSRLSRLARLGGMAGGIAGGMAWNGARLAARGQRPAMRDLLLTPGNVARVADQLSRMRGAAMKVGQLVSMDAGDMLPPELAEILARLRADADHMPPKQLRTVLNAHWGNDWLRRFRRFDVRPIAAASIGQVHRAQTQDGRDLAIKVQYPGVRASIDSDVANVGALIGLSGLLPAGLDIAPLLQEAKRQLHEEADYAREAGQLQRFGALLADAPEFVVPALHADLTTRDVLAMSFVPGQPVEAVADGPQELRDRVAGRLIGLMLRELFEFRLMQTDPNFANYRHDPATGRVVLLDFGAARAFSKDTAEGYRRLLQAGLRGDAGAVRDTALEIGFFDATTPPHQQAAVLEMIEIAFGALRPSGPFDFAVSGVAARLRDAGLALGMERDFAHIPPMDTLYLQRKVGGMFLLCSRLRAKVDVRALLERYLP